MNNYIAKLSIMKTYPDFDFFTPKMVRFQSDRNAPFTATESHFNSQGPFYFNSTNYDKCYVPSLFKCMTSLARN